MKEMCTIVHNDYEKISDKIMFLSNDYILKFNVNLNKRNKNKENFHKEFGYTVNGDFRINISRDFVPYLSIESARRSDSNKVQLQIGMNDIYFFRMKLQEVVGWFTTEQFKNLFVRKDDRIIIPVKVDSIIAHVSFGQYIEFEPTTAVFNNEQLIGVRVYLSSDNISFFMGVNTLLSLNYFIETFNMYQSAQLMLNYLGRPDNGTNYMEFQDKPVQTGFFNRVNAKNNSNQ